MDILRKTGFTLTSNVLILKGIPVIIVIGTAKGRPQTPYTNEWKVSGRKFSIMIKTVCAISYLPLPASA